jgi:Uri superfamily endonuclease
VVIDLPAEAGSYALHLALEKPQHIRVGALGEVDFPASEYVYLGIAVGPGGLRARVGRHLRADKTRHWHIDYLVPMTKLLSLCWTTSPDPLECRWSQALAQLPVVSIPVPDFGSSDCRARGGSCRAHRWFAGVLLQVVGGALCGSDNRWSGFLSSRMRSCSALR